MNRPLDAMYRIRRRLQLLCLTGLAVLLLPQPRANAQTAAKQLWFTYNQQGTLSSKWGYQFDLNHRTTAFDEWHSVVSAVRAGAVFTPRESLRLAAGYAWFGQHLQQDKLAMLHENRLWQQALWIRAKAGFNHSHRLRLEERFREATQTAAPEKVFTAYTTRLRYMLQFQGMLLRPKKEFGLALKWQAANEVMFHAGEKVGQHYFEQNRTLAGIVMAPNPHWELALLYQFSVQYLPVAERSQQLHTIRITLQHAADHRKK